MRIAVIPGDGIGKEVTAEAVKVLHAVEEKFGRTFELEHLPWSADHYVQTGETLPANGYDLLRQFDAILIGALGTRACPTTGTPVKSSSAPASNSTSTSTIVP